jgi:predicted ATPase/class 3 adenylate cyclase
VHVSTSVATLLFTDIEGSTRLWEEQRETMSPALAQHDALSRSAVLHNRGVVVKMTGDGLCAAFDDPADALQASVALLKSLDDASATNGIRLRVRLGLHVGMVERRDDDVFGSPVNRAARIMKAAHGGQALVSQAIVDQVRDRLPPGISLRDLGGVRLRDLATPEHVYQLVHPDVEQDFPALRSLEATPNNLPQQVTSFIGREREVNEAKSLLERTRLLTLLGMGGLGKTRLSLQIAADLMEKFPDGVWFVDLAPIRDPTLVPSVAAQVLAVRDEPGRPLVETLCAHVKDRKLLVVLDNCEHLIEACAQLANALLRHAPDVRILATSREALHIQGEQTYPVLPLTVPKRNAAAQDLLRSEAVQLFVERARLQAPGFIVTEREAPAVAELCARLDGIPLALELAAARLRSLSVAEINARLSDRFKLLTGGSRVALARQQTLHALVAWSYDLLDESEKVLLDRLSVFVGGFDLAAAEAVCGAAPLAADDVLDLVTSLVEKSLVMVEQSEQGSRYGMLETIRAFAQGHLARESESGTRYGLLGTIQDFAHDRLVDRGDLAATSARHCDYYLGIAKKARELLQGPEQAEWTRRMEAELDNVRAATALALAGGVDPVIAVKFEVALMGFRTLRGYAREGRNNLRAAFLLPQLQEPTVARAHALYVGGVLAMTQGDQAEAMEMFAECLAIRRALGNPREIAASLSTLATLHIQQDELAKARDCEEEALGIFLKLGDRLGEGIGLLNLGGISLRQSEKDTARNYLERCREIARSIDHRELESECECRLGELALVIDDRRAARERFARSLEICEEAEDRRNGAIALWWLGRVDAAGGDASSARSRFAEALPAFRAFLRGGGTRGPRPSVAAKRSGTPPHAGRRAQRARRGEFGSGHCSRPRMDARRSDRPRARFPCRRARHRVTPRHRHKKTPPRGRGPFGDPLVQARGRRRDAARPSRPRPSNA